MEDDVEKLWCRECRKLVVVKVVMVELKSGGKIEAYYHKGKGHELYEDKVLVDIMSSFVFR